jgi:hypothetical protein
MTVHYKLPGHDQDGGKVPVDKALRCLLQYAFVELPLPSPSEGKADSASGKVFHKKYVQCVTCTDSDPHPPLTLQVEGHQLQYMTQVSELYMLGKEASDPVSKAFRILITYASQAPEATLDSIFVTVRCTAACKERGEHKH